MTALPPVGQAALAALLMVWLLRAFFGPPPPQADRVAAAGWMAAGLLLLAVVLLAGDAARPRDLLCAMAVVSVSTSGWLLRGRRDDEPGEDEPDPVDPPPDWDEFDRLRDGWSRPKAPTSA
jgi:hypothetical protein